MPNTIPHYDVIVIGGGHAGAEAAWAASHILAGQSKVALVTMDPLAIARMSCNPAIGGLAKGQIVREIDALGGLMGRATDATAIQFRMLNRSKGPAVQSPRAQADKYAYAAEVQRLLREECPNLAIIAGIVDELLTEGGEEIGAEGSRGRGVEEMRSRISGVRLESGQTFSCRTVVVTTGTFLRGLMHTGPAQTPGGRIGEPAAKGLSLSLLNLGFQLGRLKTGTPPRLAKESIDFSGLAEQPGDDPPIPFSDLSTSFQFPVSSFQNNADAGPCDSPSSAIENRKSKIENFVPRLPQLPCHITFTNQKVHDLIRANLHRAPMYSGQIQSRGPRYCPSIEDKVVRFADKDRHQVFLEPESLSTNEIYVNGVSTSLPADVQEQIIHAIPGLEKAVILKYGYAVEYDFAPTNQINATLETKRIDGLYFAGQINGTSGYEEAGGQGLIAGINAALKIQNKGEFTLLRDQAYIGVMIDDLITKTPTEPYRMFTSRAEFRLTLRSDNTDQRLTPLGYQIGLASQERMDRLTAKLNAMQELTNLLQSLRLPLGPSGTLAYDFLRRPNVTWSELASYLPASLPEAINGDKLRAYLSHLAYAPIREQVSIQAKYAGYIDREKRTAQRLHELDDKHIPTQFDFASLSELRNEARQALLKFRPTTLGQASRLEGITPADLTVLLIHLTAK